MSLLHHPKSKHTRIHISKCIDRCMLNLNILVIINEILNRKTDIKGQRKQMIYGFVVSLQQLHPCQYKVHHH